MAPVMAPVPVMENSSPSERYRVYGLHAVRALLASRADAILAATLLAAPAGRSVEALAGELAGRGVTISRVGRAELDRMAAGGVHQGVIVEARAPDTLSVTDLEELVVRRGRALVLLVLDSVEDPRNLGACLRTANAAGVDAVVVPRVRAARLTGAALKAASGAAECVPVIAVPNLARTLAWLKSAGVWVVGADAEGEQSLYSVALAPPLAIVLGSEGQGLRRLTRELCDERVRIPMRGEVASLNVSVATGIVLFELVRQTGGA
jgi:23S rRNA (guanosine2251-2'-O)-methyltransferase